MATKIIHKKSSVAGSVPSASDLQPGELAINLADRIIYSKDTNGIVLSLTAVEINDLSDVDTYSTAPVESNVLTWNDTDQVWEPRGVPTAINVSLGTWVLGSSTTAGWAVSESSGTLRFRYGTALAMSLDQYGNIEIPGDLYADQGNIGGVTDATIGTGEWGYHDNGTNFYFQYESTNLIRLTSDGDLYVSGFFESDATLSGTVSTSYYFTNDAARVEITTDGDLRITNDITTTTS